MDSDLIVGRLVRHANMPAWGLGKIIERTHDRVWVYFKDIEGSPKDAVKLLSAGQSHLQLAETQSDPHLDNLPPMVHGGKLSIPTAFRVTEQQAIDLLYDARPNWSTYARLMTLANRLLNRLRPLGARDFIDVQSFMWEIGGEPHMRS
jgi:hypothetical protein